jgi:hypothetical protein
MPKIWDESESYEEAEFSLADLEKKPGSQARKIIFSAMVAVAVCAVLFLAGTSSGRSWAQSGSAIFIKSFGEAFGLRASGGTVAEIADDATLDVGSSTELGTDTADSEFPLAMPPAAVKKSSTKKSDAAAKAVAGQKSSGGSAGFSAEGLLAGDAILSNVPNILTATSSAVPAKTSSAPSHPASAASVPAPSQPASLPGVVVPVSVMFSGDGRGYVSSTPVGIACDGGGTCVWNFPVGAKVTLRAVHDTMSSFGGWAGACSGTAGTCALTVSGPMNVTASFRSKIAAAIVLSSPDNLSETDASVVIATSSDVAVSTDASSSSSSTDGQAESSLTPNPTAPAASIDHIVIAAVQIAGASSANDFVKLYNPTGAAVDMSGWKLHKKSNSGADYSLKVFAQGVSISAGGYFVWANSANGFADFIGADVSSTQTLSADNSVALLDASGAIVDAVAWGNGMGQYGEGPPFGTNPAASQVLTRQTVNGAMVDTDDNANDFELE